MVGSEVIPIKYKPHAGTGVGLVLNIHFQILNYLLAPFLSVQTSKPLSHGTF